jgi:flagellar hook-basal body complex protein FliE
VTVTPLPPVMPAVPAFEPDIAADGAASSASAADGFGAALRSALGEASRAFDRAAGAEAAFVAGRGGMQEMVVERAQADVVLALATSAAARTAQSLSAVFNLQV